MHLARLRRTLELRVRKPIRPEFELRIAKCLVAGSRTNSVVTTFPDFGWTAGLGDVGFGPVGGVDTDGGEDGCLEGAGAGDDFDGPVAGGEGDGADPVQLA